jgi:hypothetical protein
VVRAIKGGLILPYLQSPEFDELSERSKKDYRSQIAKIEETFGDLPLKALKDARVTKVFVDWRDSMGASPKQADYAFAVLRLMLSWGRSRGIITYSPPGRIKRLYHSNRAEKVWSDRQLSDFIAVADALLDSGDDMPRTPEGFGPNDAAETIAPDTTAIERARPTAAPMAFEHVGR